MRNIAANKRDQIPGAICNCVEQNTHIGVCTPLQNACVYVKMGVRKLRADEQCAEKQEQDTDNALAYK